MKYQTLRYFIDQGIYYSLMQSYSDVIVSTHPFSPKEIWQIDDSVAERIIWVQNPAHLKELSGELDLANYLKNAPEGYIISFMTMGDQYDYYTLREVLQQHKLYYQETGKLKNFFFFDFTHKVNPAFAEEFKDVAYFCYDLPFLFTFRITQDEINVKNFIRLDTNIKKHFLSMNARASWDRQALFYFMLQHNLLDKSYFSYLCENSNRTGYGDEFDNISAMSEGTWFSDKIDIQKAKQMIPYTLDSLTWTYGAPDAKYYSESFCSVILETHQKLNDPMITEKVLKPLGYGHSFLLFSGNNTLAELRNIGFETFGSIFDESYDTIESPQLRLEFIFKEMLRISKWSIEECQQVSKKIKPIVDHNVNHYLEIIDNSGFDILKAYTDNAIKMYEEKLPLLV